MRVYVGVEDFGKICSAKIDISNYAVFTGDNNSGKTYLMQLIYGLLQYYSFDENHTVSIAADPVQKYREQESNQITEHDMELLCQEINRDLETNKELLVRRIFQKSIHIGKLYIECIVEDDKPEIVHRMVRNQYSSDGKYQEVEEWKIQFKGEDAGASYALKDSFSDGRLLNLILFSIGIGEKYRLFMPASRTGIQMLYKEFYAHKVDRFVRDNDGIDSLGLTIPNYDFLRFLQTFKSVGVIDENRIRDFINSNIIDGQLIVDESNEMKYVPDSDSVIVPLYLASSMINELTPLVMAFTSGKKYDYIFIDEVETSLHPKKQREMARLLNRINNTGTKLIISTHSDTMASYINMLVLLSMDKDGQTGKLSKMNLEKDDLLSSSDVHIYQFSCKGQQSEVKELPFSGIPNVGVEFELFNDSLEQLYDETRILVGSE